MEEPKKKKMSFLDIVLIIILVMAIIGLCAFGFALLQNLFSGEEGEIPGAVESETAQPADAGLCLIDGKLLVGTSADYPPFETFTSDFTLDGFDIALMREIADRLAAPLEFRNIVFESLGNALQINQVSAAISAISVTPLRQEQFLFSNVYFVGSEGILAPPGSTQALITSVEQLANQRIGVQRGSVYQNWTQSNLVDSGLTPPSNIYTYQTIDLAINDLITGILDLVILDAGPANKFADQGSATLVGEGLSQQSYAIGMRQDCPALKQAIDSALVELQNDGTLAGLIQTYLNLEADEIITPTPQPATPVSPTTTPPVIPTATPGLGCMDGMAYVMDLTYPDKNMTAPPVFPPGTPFQKGWRVRNTGTCTWDYRYFLDYANGNTPQARMGGIATAVVGVVPPGSTYDLYVNLVSPAVPGIYQGFWEMHNAAGAAFGERIWVGIQVLPTNPATATPAPGLPQIYRFIVNPAYIQLGACVQINWQVYGEVTGVNLFSNGNPLWVNGPVSGTIQNCPAITGTYIYEIQAIGPGGTALASQQVTVADTPPPTATTAPLPPPAIILFDAQPSQIELGGCVNLAWQVGGTADQVRLQRNGQVILDDAPNNGTVGDCPPQPGSAVYRLEAHGAGQTASSERAVSVSQPPQPPPFVGTLWVLKELSNEQGGMQTALQNAAPTAIFNQDLSVNGEAGCNTYLGHYTATGDSLTVVVDMTSLLSCPEPPGVMEQESAFLSYLQAARRYQVVNQELKLFGPNNNLLLSFVIGALPR